MMWMSIKCWLTKLRGLVGFIYFFRKVCSFQAKLQPQTTQDIEQKEVCCIVYSFTITHFATETIDFHSFDSFCCDRFQNQTPDFPPSLPPQSHSFVTRGELWGRLAEKSKPFTEKNSALSSVLFWKKKNLCSNKKTVNMKDLCHYKFDFFSEI